MLEASQHLPAAVSSTGTLTLKPMGLRVLFLAEVGGYIQDPPGQGPVQPAVGDPASAGGLD